MDTCVLDFLLPAQHLTSARLPIHFSPSICIFVHCNVVQEDILTIFEAADTDHSGTLTIEEFQDVLEDIIIRYPQVELYLKSKHLFEVMELFKDSEGNEREEVDIEGFKSALSHVDSQMKSLPATAQVYIPP